MKLQTKDGLTLEADWYEGEKGMPGVVGLHMYPADRSSWSPLASARPEGWHFLAIDMRGYGGSRMQGSEDLSARVKSRDGVLFRAMALDALAGIEFLRAEKRCDPKRIGLVGASVGCSVSIDAAVRDGKIAGVAVMTPGKEYLGVPTMDHVKSWGETPLLLLSSEEEAERGARPLAAELKGRPAVELRIVPGEKIHGTNMFGKVEGIEGDLWRWFEAALGREFLDGVLDGFEARDDVAPGDRTAQWTSGGVRARWDRDAFQFVLQAREGQPLPETVVIQAWPVRGADGSLGTRRLRGTFTAEGALIAAWSDTREGAGWKEQPLGSLPGIAVAKGSLLEARIPWALLGAERGTKVAVSINFGPVPESGTGPDWRWGVKSDDTEIPK